MYPLRGCVRRRSDEPPHRVGDTSLARSIRFSPIPSPLNSYAFNRRRSLNIFGLARAPDGDGNLASHHSSRSARNGRPHNSSPRVCTAPRYRGALLEPQRRVRKATVFGSSNGYRWDSLSQFQTGVLASAELNHPADVEEGRIAAARGARGACLGRGSDAARRVAPFGEYPTCDSLKSPPRPRRIAPPSPMRPLARDGPSAAQTRAARRAVAVSGAGAARATFGPSRRRVAARRADVGESGSSSESSNVSASCVSPAVPAAPRRFAPPFAPPPLAAARFMRWSCASSRNCAGSASSSQFRMSQSSARVVRLRLCSLNASARSRSASTAGAVAFIAAATAFAPKPFFSSCAHVLRSTSSGSTSTRMSTSTGGGAVAGETREPFDPPGWWAPGRRCVGSAREEETLHELLVERRHRDDLVGIPAAAPAAPAAARPAAAPRRRRNPDARRCERRARGPSRRATWRS